MRAQGNAQHEAHRNCRARHFATAAPIPFEPKRYKTKPPPTCLGPSCGGLAAPVVVCGFVGVCTAFSLGVVRVLLCVVVVVELELVVVATFGGGLRPGRVEPEGV